MLLKRENKVIVHIDFPILVIAVAKRKKILGKMICVIEEAEKRITISDITCEKNNRGYGSLMMEKLIEFARSKQYDYIDGWLSKVDCDHKERLYYFYGKFGFEIISYNGGMKFANIKLHL